MDRDKPLAMLPIRDFRGIMSNVDPHDLPPGAAVSQVNLVVIKVGEMRVRGGYRVVTFDSN